MVKMCECGCGNPAPIAKETNRVNGHVKGEPVRFIARHQSRKYHLERLEEYGVMRANGCLEWTGGLTSRGRAVVWTGSRQMNLARFVAARAAGRMLAAHEFVTHTCDNILCFELSHLVIADAASNSSDMVQRGRSMRGARNHNSKLQVWNVAEIKQLLSMKRFTHREIAARFGVSRATVHHISTGLKWGYVDAAV